MVCAENAMLKIKFHQPHQLKLKISIEFNHFYKGFGQDVSGQYLIFS